MKRGLLATVFLALSITNVRAGGVDGHELLKNCSTFASPIPLTTYEQGYCLGFVSGASELLILLNETGGRKKGSAYLRRASIIRYWPRRCWAS
jgi:hypothetical protein